MDTWRPDDCTIEWPGAIYAGENGGAPATAAANQTILLTEALMRIGSSDVLLQTGFRRGVHHDGHSWRLFAPSPLEARLLRCIHRGLWSFGCLRCAWTDYRFDSSTRTTRQPTPSGTSRTTVESHTTSG